MPPPGGYDRRSPTKRAGLRPPPPPSPQVLLPAARPGPVGGGFGSVTATSGGAGSDGGGAGKALLRYEVTFVTGDARNAGTDGVVSVSLEGTLGSSGWTRLEASPDNVSRAGEGQSLGHGRVQPRGLNSLRLFGCTGFGRPSSAPFHSPAVPASAAPRPSRIASPALRRGNARRPPRP